MLLIFPTLFGQARRPDAPSGARNFFESILEFLRVEVFRPALKEHTDRFVPFLWTLFFFILFCNLLGQIPIGEIVTRLHAASRVAPRRHRDRHDRRRPARWRSGHVPVHPRQRHLAGRPVADGRHVRPPRPPRRALLRRHARPRGGARSGARPRRSPRRGRPSRLQGDRQPDQALRGRRSTSKPPATTASARATAHVDHGHARRTAMNPAAAAVDGGAAVLLELRPAPVQAGPGRAARSCGSPTSSMWVAAAGAGTDRRADQAVRADDSSVRQHDRRPHRAGGAGPADPGDGGHRRRRSASASR